MEIEHAIILALSEPRNYTNLCKEARTIRKQNGETLSKESFNVTIKRLFADKFVNKKQVNGREVSYSLNLEKSTLVNNIMKIIYKIDDQISSVEEFTKLVEGKAETIDEGRKQIIKLQLKKINYIFLL